MRRFATQPVECGPMIILAIETSCEKGSLALFRNGRVVESELDGVASHSEGVLSAIECLLVDAGLSLSELDGVAFGSGPGAFTGLRLACGIAQGLALGAGIGVCAVSSLDALASQASAPRVLAATDARLGEVYWRLYEHRDGASLQAIGEVSCSKPGEMDLPAGEWCGIGSAFAVHAEALQASLSGRLAEVCATAVPRAADVARLAAARVPSVAWAHPTQVAPLYVRDKVALTTAERLAAGGRA